ncbi:MAG: YqeG family HAD IIIA-type phosphatase [Fimbriimonadales bacterium]|nr:YqeG family HAD IIIA-type phosphatase [Fimbriimonadales bacterium]
MRFRKEASPRWLRRWCPDEHVSSVAEITPARLQAHGICALLLDLDNTITPWRSRQVPPEIAEWVKRMQAAGIKLCFVSNTRNLGRLQRLSEQLNIPYARGPMKPRRAMLRRALEMLSVSPQQAAIVGDQLFTDIWGGNRLGLYTIWVRPMHPREFIGTKVSRQVERWLLKRLERYRVDESAS